MVPYDKTNMKDGAKKMYKIAKMRLVTTSGMPSIKGGNGKILRDEKDERNTISHCECRKRKTKTDTI